MAVGKNNRLAMTERLRKVVFSLSPEDGYLPDLTEEEMQMQEEDSKKRNGWFHQWTDIEFQSAHTGRHFQKTVALIEECETGKIHYILPELITFEPIQCEDEQK